MPICRQRPFAQQFLQHLDPQFRIARHAIQQLILDFSIDFHDQISG